MNKELEKKNLEHRMELLRSQIHPHFLFNTLNNLYSLAVDQSKKVPEIIIKISNILRYMLKEYNKKVVSLSEELDIIFTYIELEKLRYGEQLNIEINNEVKEIYQSIIKGPPLVLFTFVENAFKHGPGKSINNSWIKIDIKYIYGELIFKVENNKEEIESNHRNNQNGLGLKNAKTTLDLYFHNKYKLDILKNQDSFKIELKINYKNEN
ncbi:MAG: sensor histidine kinase [Thiohalospira sp.]